MKRDVRILGHEFVEFVPEQLVEGVLYISMRFATAVHLCACGCGQKVVTPFSPTDWKMIFDGDTVTLDPSIGNWAFGCQSHYWIRANKIVWAPRWSREKISAARADDVNRKASYYSNRNQPADYDRIEMGGSRPSMWSRIKKRFL